MVGFPMIVVGVMAVGITLFLSVTNLSSINHTFEESMLTRSKMRVMLSKIFFILLNNKIRYHSRYATHTSNKIK